MLQHVVQTKYYLLCKYKVKQFYGYKLVKFQHKYNINNQVNKEIEHNIHPRYPETRHSSITEGLSINSCGSFPSGLSSTLRICILNCLMRSQGLSKLCWGTLKRGFDFFDFVL